MNQNQNQTQGRPVLSNREMAFLRAFAEKGNITEAGRTAGFPEKKLVQNCTKLMARPQAQKYLKEYRDSLKPNGREAVREALLRIAFGQNNDAVSLAMSERELSPEEISSLDLFGISELKQIKGGGLEIKFTSRLEALKLLYELEQNDSGGDELSRFWNDAKASAENFPYEEDGYVN